MSTPLPPGPDNRELLGKVTRIQSDPLDFLTSLSSRFGGIALFHVFALPVIVITDPEGIQHVLQDNHRHYSKDTIQYNALVSITGRGLLTNDGPDWLRQRRLTQPAFSRQRLAALDQIAIPAAQAMLERWETPARSGQIVDIDREMMQVTLEIVGKALFSIDLRAEAHDLTGAVLTTLDHIVYRARNMVTPPLYLPTPRNLRFKRALALLDRTVYAMIKTRKKAKDPGDDLLGMLLRARDEETGHAMSERQVRDELMTMLVAGHETVASALTWAWLLLAQNPQQRECLYQEVLTALSGRLPTSADLPALAYTAAAFSESLRLYPPAWLITRKAMDEDTVLGCRVPKGALIVLSPFATHHNPGQWPEPETFDPRRFLEATENPLAARQRFSYIPFGAGPRLCIGNHFAQVEAALLMACIAQRYRLEMAGPPPAVDALVTLRPHGGLPMRLSPLRDIS